MYWHLDFFALYPAILELKVALLGLSSRLQRSLREMVELGVG